MNFPLPPHIERLSLALDVPFEFSFYVPDSIQSLQLDHLDGVAFKPSKLHGFKLMSIRDVLTNPLPLDLPETLETCLALKSFSMRFYYLSSASYLQNMLDILAKLVDLQTISICDVPDLNLIEGSIVIRQSDFPSIKSFIWDIVINVTFHCLDVFDSIFFTSGFTLYSDEITFKFCSSKYTTVIPPNASRLSRLKFMRIIDWSIPLPRKFDDLVQVANIESISYKYISRKSDCSHLLLPWIASLPSLKKFRGEFMLQEQVICFLTNLKSTRPTVVIEHSDTHVMSDELHRIVKDLKAKNEIADFVTPWKCRCQDGCWLWN